MKNRIKSWTTGVFLSAWAVTAFAADTNSPAIIPLPAKMEQHDGVFELKPKTHIIVDAPSRDTGEYLAEHLRKSTGYKFKLRTSDTGDAVKGGILLTTKDANAALGAEGYELDVTPDSVVIRAPAQAGLFYGVQSLLQLLPPEIFSTNAAANVAWTMPCVHVEDQPRFQWRGLMLDVARHFYSKQEVETVLDLMALHKMNTFHWHLVDDQGWRIEIKKYPKLTEIGAWRKEVGFKLDPKSTTAYGPDGRYGGFYTQDDIREVVAYAAARHITIVPEIEMPGHSTAALMAYPEYSCTGGPFTTDLPGGIFNGIYCAGNDKTFDFVDDVLTEVFQLFPGKYIHIGGDEVTVDNWKACPKCQARMKEEGLTKELDLEHYFIRRIEKFVNANGRCLIGWSEICEGDLAPNTAVMDWIGGSVQAASSGHNVVMTSTSHCYFDQYQVEDHSTEPHAIGGFISVKKVYAYEPVPRKLAPKDIPHILGAQGNLWTEYIPNLNYAEYMIFPRATALAEVTWSPRTSRNWKDFARRLQVDQVRLDELGANYRRVPPPALAENSAK